MFEFLNTLKNLFISDDDISYVKINNDDKDNNSDSDSDNEDKLFRKRNRIHEITKKKEESLIVEPGAIELALKKENPPISIRSRPGAPFEIQRQGTDCYMGYYEFYNEFINRVSYFPEYRKATSITWPSCVPEGQTALFSRQMEYVNIDLIYIYHKLCKKAGFSKNVLQFIEESLKEDTPWIIIHLAHE